MIFDSHMHAKFSADSQMSATEAVNRAASLNCHDFGLELDGREFSCTAAKEDANDF